MHDKGHSKEHYDRFIEVMAQKDPFERSNSRLGDWISATLARIQNESVAIPDAERRRYDPGATSCKHYIRIANRIFEDLEDLVLAKAGLLHGLRINTIRRCGSDVLGGAKDDRARIKRYIEGRQRLSALFVRRTEDGLVRDASGVEDSSTLFEDQAMAGLLYTMERLDHVDPKQNVLKWTEKYYKGTQSGDWPDWPYADSAEILGPPDPRITSKQILADVCRGTYATVAKTFGYWLEYAALDNVGSFLHDPERFRQLYDIVQELSESYTERFCDFIGQALNLPREHIYWDWRHLASIDEILRKRSVGTALQAEERRDVLKAHVAGNLHRFGFCTIRFGEPQDAYGILGKIHAQMAHRPGQLEDYIGRQTFENYSALHTVVEPELKHAQASTAVAVRIITITSDNNRRARISEASYDRALSQKGSGNSPTIEVMTPEGNVRRMKPGATVMDFAVEMDAEYATLLREASVDRVSVSLLHPLERGNVVDLKKGARPKPPPAGWREMMTPDYRKRFEEHFRAHYAEELQAIATDWLNERLHKDGIPLLSQTSTRDLVDSTVRMIRGRLQAYAPERDGMEETEAESRPDWVPGLSDIMGDEATRGPARGRSEKGSTEWWLETMGVYVSLRRGDDIPHRLIIDEEEINLFISALRHQARERSPRLETEDLVFPDHLSPENVEICERCDPELATEILGTVNHDGKTLLIHARNRDCQDKEAASDAFHVELQGRSGPQYIVLETNNQVGVAEDIFKTFTQLEIDVQSLVGRRLGIGSGVFRIELLRSTEDQINQVVDQLANLNAVRKCYAPNDTAPLELERHLPAPGLMTRVDTTTRSHPYTHREAVRDQRRFYGRAKALDAILSGFRETITTGAGKTMALLAPLRTGKSSVALQCRHVIRDHLRNENLCYTYVHGGGGWGPRIARKIHRSWQKQVGKSESRDWGASDSGYMDVLLDALDRLRAKKPTSAAAAAGREEIPLLLVIDEATGMMLATDHQAEKDNLRQFVEAILDRPATLLLWVGPEPWGSSSTDALLVDLLGRSPRVPFDAPITLEETASLLRAEKLSEYKISVPHEVVEHVYKMTGGNPLLSNEMGIKMWERNNGATSSTPIAYSMDDANEAALSVAACSGLFAKRLPTDPSYVLPHPIKADAQALLDQIARHLSSAGTESADRILSTGEIADLSRNRKLHKPLNALLLTGALRHSKETSQDKEGFQIASRLLFAYLRSRLSKIDS